MPAPTNLRLAIWRLRKALEKPTPRVYFRADNVSIAFDARAAYWLDAQALTGPRPAEPTTAELIEAVAHCHGELLPGFYDDWVVLERERLRGLFEAALTRLLEQLVAARRWEEVLTGGERGLAQGPAAEPA